MTDTDGLAERAAPVPVVSTPEAGEPGDAPTAFDAGDGGSEAATGSTYRSAVTADAPLAYFPFDEPAGATFAKDLVGGRVASVVTKATFGAAGIGGGAVAFDGSGYLDAGDVLDWIGDAPITFELWARPSAPDGAIHNVLEKRAFAPDLLGYVFYFRDQPTFLQVENWGSDGGGRSAWVEVPATPLVHFVYTFDPKDGARLYANGVQSANAYPGSGGAPDLDAPLVIGGGFVGVLDELAVYDHALSTERVAAHFSARN